MKILNLENLIAWIRDLFDQYDYNHSDTSTIRNLRDSADDQNFWQIRESVRFAIRDYAYIPDPVLEKLNDHGIMLNADHFLHCSTDQPGMIAYTPSDDYGKQDRQIRSKFGKYLRANFGDQLSDPVIADIANTLRGNMDQSIKLLIAETADDIAQVYVDGPESCMDGDHFSHIGDHPTRVYGSSDTACAYIMRGDNITGRAIIRHDTKEWIRLYGDEENLRDALQENGYSAGGDLSGCKLLKIENGSGDFIFPYLDGVTTGVDDHGDHFIVTNCGEYDGETQYGTLEDSNRQSCDDCGGRHHDDDMHYLEFCERSVCNSCIESNYTFAYIGKYQEYVSDCESVYEHNGEYYTSDGCDYHNLIIIDCEAYDLDDCVETIDGEMIHCDDAIACQDSSGDQVYTDDRDLVCDDAITGDPILIDGSTEIVIDIDGETGRTIETDLVYAAAYDALINCGDSETLSDGSSVLDSDDDRIAADDDQESFPFYSAAVIAHTDQIITSDRDSFAPDSGSI